MLTFRLIQGIGAGAAAVLSVAAVLSMVVVRDLFEGNEARARLSYVSILRSLGPMIAPTIGAWLLTFTQMVVGAVSSAIVAFLYNGSALAMTGIMAAFIFSAASVYFLRVRPAEKKC